MKTIMPFFLILTIGFSSYAQNKDSKLNTQGTAKPILIINDSIIGSMDLLKNISSDKILDLRVFNDKKLSSTSLFIENDKIAGLIIAHINHEFKLKSQKELNLFFGLHEKNDVYVNGYLVENKSQHISSESIVCIKLIKADQFRLKKPVLNIEIE
ncbi:hypothetical protein DFQ11_101563 [Winogradskyella epiphytica]|uniref:Uncharacterized protein n=1 Tax=Winogradskyella epiphytica TaxID=262005 RepID=A0A2V4WZQ1_9FLAO|nr:hypothetical protein [Winogradskyella epiphytica]PYE83132.1 hypothetical protein DFQ11_101563 [Winogradskyella epiphytica]GGW56028.1 hypothetical protein GCM10008085_04300 [Winogradskyella epiphytica]